MTSHNLCGQYYVSFGGSCFRIKVRIRKQIEVGLRVELEWAMDHRLTSFLLFVSHNQPSIVASPTTTIKRQKGNCFEMSIVLCSLLIGAGYDAYCVCGYATREVTLMDQTRDICPLLKQENKVSVTWGLTAPSIYTTDNASSVYIVIIFQGNFHTFSTAKLLIHASILMQNTVQIVLNSNTKLLKSKYDLKFVVSGLP